MRRKSLKRSCKRRCRRKGAGARRTGRAACRTYPRLPSARPPRAASPRCRPWRRRGGRRARSWSDAALTWSVSYVPALTACTTTLTSFDRVR